MEMDGSYSSHSRRKAGRNQDPDIRLSKLLSYALRHGAATLGLPIGSDGYVPVSSLLTLPQFRSFSQDDVERVVRCNDKQRFTLRSSEAEGQLEIRANQGHSLQVEVDLIPLGTELPPQAIHGTFLRHWPSILSHGLSRMERTHIHLSTQLPGEADVISGMRRDCEVAIFIDLQKAIAGFGSPIRWPVLQQTTMRQFNGDCCKFSAVSILEGSSAMTPVTAKIAAVTDHIPFFWSANRVLLTPGNADGILLPKYFLKVLQLRPQRMLLQLE